MARSQRLRRHPPVLPPKTSLRVLVLATFSFLAFVVLVIGISSSANSQKRIHKRMTQGNHVRFSTPEEVPDDIVATLDAVLVLGGGVPLSLEQPPPFSAQRCQDAATIVQRHSSLVSQNNKKHHDDKKLATLCLSAGTAHLPQLLSGDGLPVWEATSSAAYLLKHYPDSIDKSQVYVETTSYDTIGNAFYARTSFTDITGWRRLLVITNEVRFWSDGCCCALWRSIPWSSTVQGMSQPRVCLLPYYSSTWIEPKPSLIGSLALKMIQRMPISYTISHHPMSASRKRQSEQGKKGKPRAKRRSKRYWHPSIVP